MAPRLTRIKQTLSTPSKSNNSTGYEEHNSGELPNFELKFFDGPPPKELIQLVEQRLSKTGPQKNNNNNNNNNNNRLVCFNLSRLVMHTGNFRDNFSAIWRQ